MKTPKVIFDYDHPAFNVLVGNLNDILKCVKGGCNHDFSCLIFELEEMRLVYGIKINVQKTLDFFIEDGIKCDHELVKKFYRNR